MLLGPAWPIEAKGIDTCPLSNDKRLPCQRYCLWHTRRWSVVRRHSIERSIQLFSKKNKPKCQPIFLPTLPIPLPTTLMIICPSCFSALASLMPHPAAPKERRSLASWIFFSFPSTSLPSWRRPTSSEPIAIRVMTVGAASNETHPPLATLSSNWYAHPWPISSGGRPPAGGEAISAEYRHPVDDSATSDKPNPRPTFFFTGGLFFSVVETKAAADISEKTYVSATRGFRTPRAASIIRALLEPDVPVEYATPRIFFTLPGFSKCNVFGSLICCPNTSWTSPAPPSPLGPGFDLCMTRSSMLRSIPKCAYRGRIAVRKLSIDR